MMKSLGKRYADLKGKEKKGFTLLELVVVIAIMAILALVLVPNLTAWIGKADEAKLDANLKTVHTSAELVRQTSKEDKFDGEAIGKFANVTSVTVVDTETAAEAAKTLAKDAYLVYKDGAGTVVIGKNGNLTKSFDGKVYNPFPVTEEEGE